MAHSDPHVREASEFLKHSNSAGKADFHALRHTFLTRLSRSGASPKVLQMMARHSTITITYDRYVHADMTDLATAVQALEPLPVTLQTRSAVGGENGEGNQMVAGLVAASIDLDRGSVRSIEQNRPFLQASS